MKKTKNILILLLVISFLFISCDKETIEIPNKESESDFSEVKIKSENTLKFKNKETFEKFVREINKKNDKEKLLFCLKYNLKTPFERMVMADKELENILNNSSTREDFNTQYALFKKKFSEDFFFEDETKLDFSPYSKFVNSELECIINLSGNYIIGDSVYKAPTYDSLTDILNSSIRSSDFDSQNYAIGNTRNRRCEAWISITGTDIYLKFVGKRKYWLGWFKRTMSFNGKFKLTANNSQHQYMCNYFEFYASPYFGYTEEVYKDLDNKEFIISTKPYSELTVNFGRVVIIQMLVLPSLNGYMEIWSSEVDYEHRGKASVNLVHLYN